LNDINKEGCKYLIYIIYFTQEKAAKGISVSVEESPIVQYPPPASSSIVTRVRKHFVTLSYIMNKIKKHII
jgi:hypothetical protein